MKTRTVREIRLHNARLLQQSVGGQRGMIEITGRSQSQLSALMGENAFKPIGNKIARSLEQVFGKQEGWLDTWHETLNDSASAGTQENVKHYQGGARLIPLISWVSAGAFCEAVDNFQPGEADEWLPCPSTIGEHAYALRVEGDSMTSPYPGQRSYPAGTVIFVDPDRQVTNGARVIAKLLDSQEVTFKVYAEDAGRKFLKPLNPQYPTTEITEGTHICGVVVGSYWPE